MDYFAAPKNQLAISTTIPYTPTQSTKKKSNLVPIASVLIVGALLIIIVIALLSRRKKSVIPPLPVNQPPEQPASDVHQPPPM